MQIKKRFKKIYVEITNICNLRCSFCPDTKRIKENMSKENFNIIIKKIKPYTDLISLHIKGEPLLHPELDEILKICDEENIKVNITTNGTLLKNKIDILLKHNSIRQLNISIHSINKNETNEKYNLYAYMENVFYAVNEISKNTNIIISYRLWNLEKIEENKENIDLLKLLEKEYKINNLINIVKKEKFVEFSKRIFLNQDLEFKWPDINSKIISEEGKCRALKDQIGILVNGDVIPCCLDQEGEIKLGNLLNEDLETILNSELSKNIKKGFDENKLIHNLCKRCGFVTKFSNKGE